MLFSGMFWASDVFRVYICAAVSSSCGVCLGTSVCPDGYGGTQFTGSAEEHAVVLKTRLQTAHSVTKYNDFAKALFIFKLPCGFTV
jgi:hypothetical protein